IDFQKVGSPPGGGMQRHGSSCCVRVAQNMQTHIRIMTTEFIGLLTTPKTIEMRRLLIGGPLQSVRRGAVGRQSLAVFLPDYYSEVLHESINHDRSKEEQTQHQQAKIQQSALYSYYAHKVALVYLCFQYGHHVQSNSQHQSTQHKDRMDENIRCAQL